MANRMTKDELETMKKENLFGTSAAKFRVQTGQDAQLKKETVAAVRRQGGQR